ncbi:MULTISPECIES: septum site-determining protein Ssd [unclassified Nocardioides]|uniref:septum site-determining protein Ssd n=1 Tax=unclassified Nocardioides TaxID=2615069 RepID=UPI00240642CA|nr:MULTISPECIES: septum site-determining protein Ssd [unclassified Nocardioides]MDF9715788.1 septum site determining protein [Nocardioides sp. ChNu-99]
MWTRARSGAARSDPSDAGEPGAPPLLATADPDLRAAVERLAAATGAGLEVVEDPVAALARWQTAPLVLVGADLAPTLGDLRPARRDAVHVLAATDPPPVTYRAAVELGASSVAALPGATEWLAEQLGDQEDARGGSRTVAVVGGSGGAGATVLACAAGAVAAAAGPAVVVDLDPWGPGADRLLGLEDADGVRWDALAGTVGRIGGRALREALPRRGDLGVLTQGGAGGSGSSGGPGGPTTGGGEEPPLEVVREVLAAAGRGHDTVVLDLPRRSDARTAELAARADLVVVVVDPTLAGVASAARVVGWLGGTTPVGVVVRGPGARPEQVARAVGAPLVGELPSRPRLVEPVLLGVGPLRVRGALAAAAAQVLDVVGATVGRAA